MFFSSDISRGIEAIEFFFFFAVEALPGDYKKGFECISQKVI